jgi:hypothetical protein
MRHVITELAARLPPSERAKPDADDMVGYGCLTQIMLLAPAYTALCSNRHRR